MTNQYSSFFQADTSSMCSKYMVDLEVEVETSPNHIYSLNFCSKRFYMGALGKKKSTLEERMRKSQQSHTQSGQRVYTEVEPVLPACLAGQGGSRLGSPPSHIRFFHPTLPKKYVEDIEFFYSPMRQIML